MKKILSRYIAIVLIGVLAFFYCGNTIFVHTHQVGNVRIVHSHIPLTEKGVPHSHSDSSLKVISWFNLALHSIENAVVEHVPDRFELIEQLVEAEECVVVENANVGLSLLRAPPQKNI